MAQQIKRTNTNTNKETIKDVSTEETNISILPNGKIEQPDKEIKEDKNDSELEYLRNALDDKDKQIDLLNKNFALLQEQLSLLMKQGLGQPVATAQPAEDIMIGCRAMYQGVLATNDGSYQIKFGWNEEKAIDSEDLKIILKDNGLRNNKKLFEDDIFYFVNPEDYEKFKIRKRRDLSRKNIIRILTQCSTNDMIGEINKLTNNLVDFTIVHVLQFQICGLLIDPSAPLANWNYDDRKALERYLNRPFDDLMAAVGAVDLCKAQRK